MHNYVLRVLQNQQIVLYNYSLNLFPAYQLQADVSIIPACNTGATPRFYNLALKCT